MCHFSFLRKNPLKMQKYFGKQIFCKIFLGYLYCYTYFMQLLLIYVRTLLKFIYNNKLYLQFIQGLALA